jgi:hypothetical protein
MMHGRKIFSLRYWMEISCIQISWKDVKNWKREEGLRVKEEATQDAFMINGQDELTEERREILGKIIKKAMLIQEHRIMKRTAYSRPIVPRKHDKDRKFITKRMSSQSRGSMRGHGAELMVTIWRYMETANKV